MKLTFDEGEYFAGLGVMATVGVLTAVTKRGRTLAHSLFSAVAGQIRSVHDRAGRRSRRRLERQVLMLAATRQVDVAVSRDGFEPAVVTFHPSGRQHAYYSTMMSYRAAMERGEWSPLCASAEKVPMLVSEMTAAELTAWLARNRLSRS